MFQLSKNSNIYFFRYLLRHLDKNFTCQVRRSFFFVVHRFCLWCPDIGIGACWGGTRKSVITVFIVAVYELLSYEKSHATIPL